MGRAESRDHRGTQYYVDAVAGVDAGSGTSPVSAWATLGRANRHTFAPGDHLLLKAGQVFEGSLVLDAADAGTPAAPVVIGSYGTGTATISAGMETAVSVRNAGGVELRDLTVVGTSYAVAKQVPGIEFAIDLGGATMLEHVRVDNVDVSGFGGAGVTVGSRPEDGTKSGFRDVRITRVRSHGNANGIMSYGPWDPTSGDFSHENLYVADNRVYANAGLPGVGSHSGNGIVLGDVDGALIERNVAFENGARNDWSDGGPVGIWAWDANRVTIQHNESFSNRSTTIDGGGFDLDGGVTNSVMQYNYSHDNDGAGYLVCQFYGARPFRNNVVRYNISENDARLGTYGALHFWDGNQRRDLVNTVVHNNTIFVGPSDRGSPTAILVLNPTESTRCFNNIVITTGGVPHVAAKSGQDTNAEFRGNSYWTADASDDGEIRVEWADAVYSSLDGWAKATGQERDGDRTIGLVGDPRLTDPGGGRAIGDADALGWLRAYRLRGDSPLRGASVVPPGTDLGEIDFFGTPLPRAGVDIGACQQQNGLPCS